MEENLKILKMRLSDTKNKKENLKKNLEELLKKKSKTMTDLGITNGSSGFIQTTINFFKSEFFNFMYKYLFFLVIFTLCFYVLNNVDKSTNIKLIIYENKIFHYLVIFFIIIFMNDIFQTPQENIFKFIILILLSLVASYYSIKLVDKANTTHFLKGLLVIASCIIIAIISLILFYYIFKKTNPFSSYNLMKEFNKTLSKNYKFMIFIFIYILFYYKVYHVFNRNTRLSDILCPTITGTVLLFFVFCYFIFIAIKIKLLNQLQILNSFIAFISILIFIVILNLFIFINSLENICTEPNEEVHNLTTERLTLLIFLALFIILWLDDTRTWHQIGSIFFIIASVIMMLTMFYYSTIYPSISLLSFWLFIEWMIIVFRQKDNSKNSFHYSFMSV